MPEPESDTERDPVNECTICKKGICKRSTTPCQHSFCYPCLKRWAVGSLKVNAAGVAEAECPLCRQLFGSFKHHVNRTFKLYPPGQCPAGRVEKHRRRYRKRRRPKKNGAAAAGQQAPPAAGGQPNQRHSKSTKLFSSYYISFSEIYLKFFFNGFEEPDSRFG